MNNLYKLSTKEDSFLIHKILGSICLINFLYRFSLLLTTNSMKFETPLDLYLISIHGVLSVSSLIFRISSSRNEKQPIIYPELRLHSIIFALRSIICCFLIYFNFPIIYRIIVCYLTMISADIITLYTKKGTTIRNMPYSEFMNENDRKDIIYHYSRSQVGATMFMLGNINSCFSPLLAIQIAAFLMTLVKKNIIKGHYFHLVYTLCLWMNAFVFLSLSPGWIIPHSIGCNIFAYLRFKNSINKYLSWFIVFGIHYLLIYLQIDIQLDNLIEYLGINLNFVTYLIIIGYLLKNILTHTCFWKELKN